MASLLEVEEWAGDWWEPSSIPLTTASLSPTADEAVLRARGVPIEDCASSEPRIAQLDIETLMMTRDPERAEQVVFDEDVSRSTGPRRRKYPGNSRFRRGRPARGDTAIDAERRGDGASEWTGPRRRATDHPPDSASA